MAAPNESSFMSFHVCGPPAARTIRNAGGVAGLGGFNARPGKRFARFQAQKLRQRAASSSVWVKLPSRRARITSIEISWPMLFLLLLGQRRWDWLRLRGMKNPQRASVNPAVQLVFLFLGVGRLVPAHPIYGDKHDDLLFSGFAGGGGRKLDQIPPARSGGPDLRTNKKPARQGQSGFSVSALAVLGSPPRPQVGTKSAQKKYYALDVGSQPTGQFAALHCPAPTFNLVHH
jgi:hypothetical protein